MMNRGLATMRSTDSFNYAGIALLALLLAAGGCATKPKAKTNYLLYPSPPDEPRLQYLTGFSSERDLFAVGGFKKFILGNTIGNKFVGKPYGVASRKNQLLFCDSGASGVGIVDLEKRSLDYFLPPGQGKMQTPINAAVDAKGNLYVTDTGREQVLIFGPDGTPIDVLGKKDEMKPCGIAIAGQNLFVTDLKNHQVRVYDLPPRNIVRTIPRPDDDGKGKLFSPVNITIDPQGRTYVADPGAFCVQAYDAEGKHLRTLGGQGIGPGQFARPRGLAADREGRVYVVDAGTQRVQLFDSEGQLLIFFGDPTITGPGATSLPAGVAVDYENVRYFEKYAAPGHKLEYLILLTNQYGSPKISVYGFFKNP
jgi:sugar lactone lactonase YvrE